MRRTLRPALVLMALAVATAIAVVALPGPVRAWGETAEGSTATVQPNARYQGFLDIESERYIDTHYVELRAGEVARAVLSIKGDPMAADLDMTAWHPDRSLEVATAWGVGYPEQMWIAANSAGRYSIDVESWDGAANYELEIDVVSRTKASVSRMDGSDRYDTAAKAAAEAFPGWKGITDVIVAGGDDRSVADPLTAAGMAGAYKAPLLLTASKLRNGKLPSATEAALAQVRAANGGKVRIRVVGGTVPVPPDVYKRLSALKGEGGSIERISGADRYATSAAMAKRAAAVHASRGQRVPFVMLANGETPAAFYDALAASPISYHNVAPMLLVQKDSVPSSVARELVLSFDNTERIVVNGVDYASDTVFTAVRAETRLASSANRYIAANEIAGHAVAHKLLRPHYVAVAAKLPDALTGGVSLGELGGTILYSDGTGIDEVSAERLRLGKGGFDRVYVVGGPVAVKESAVTRLRALTQF